MTADAPCLHCYINEAVTQFCRDTGRIHSDGQPIYEELVILRALAVFAAEVIAGHDNPVIRENRVEILAHSIRTQAAELARAGHHSAPRATQ